MENGNALIIEPLNEKYRDSFVKDMQEAFQKGAEAENGKTEDIILPERDIVCSLSKRGAAAYQAMIDDRILGGAIVVVDEKSKYNHLEFLYVKYGCQNTGIGKKIWDALEKLYPDTLVWETVTPYFEKRNIHFYINQCGFHAVEFYNPRHKDPHMPEESTGGDCFFRFEKSMQSLRW